MCHSFDARIFASMCLQERGRLENKDQGSISTDANLFFTRTFGMTAQAVKSYGPFGHGTWLYFVRPAYDSLTDLTLHTIRTRGRHRASCIYATIFVFPIAVAVCCLRFARWVRDSLAGF